MGHAVGHAVAMQLKQISFHNTKTTTSQIIGHAVGHALAMQLKK
jgi:hypothetical protein